ncbi:hypothetical protein CEP51_008122 [Fusarium floridanum]|uniref:Uncharacterized protein n=1 Tax=Fusarium floridanum TaxID=1325733 RepID=A0A428RLY8_9HYPO|nr:hypothetical protein CEP51_008122 [Fusarium floridanum]
MSHFAIPEEECEELKPLPTLRTSFLGNALWVHDFDRCEFIGLDITDIKKSLEPKRATSRAQTDETWWPCPRFLEFVNVGTQFSRSRSDQTLD